MSALFFSSACSNRESDALTVSVASSLTRPMLELIDEFGKSSPSVKVNLNTGSSGALAQQFLNGAQVDLLISAHDTWVEKLVDEKKVEKVPDHLSLGNELVVIVPDNSPLESFEDLLSGSSKTFAVGAFESVPVGLYTQAWLKEVGKLSDFKGRLVFLKNEQQVLRAVESRHAEAGVVYRSSFHQSTKVRILHVPPPSSYPPIRYGFATAIKAGNRPALEAFLAFLQSPTAKKIWRDHGFQVVE